MPVTLECPICDNEFDVRPSQLYRSNGPYCSRTCAQKANQRAKKLGMPMPRATVIRDSRRKS
jgi:hypothetical protein